ncbi:MAG: TetR/AcrR family transcriptional regulator [Candidatus Aminicenantes bacterium]|nr:TetR/AcrR family transcriptional regulator [Candidatus Aminicenantes bacterium]
MSIRARIDSEKQKLRRLILEATVDLLAQEGYEQVSIRKVASLIGYSATTIYLYFKNKADLIQNVVDDGYARFMLRLAAASRGGALSPLQQLSEGMRIYIGFALENPNWYRVTFSSRLGRSNNDAQFLTESATGEKGFAVLAMNLEQAMASAEIPRRSLYPAVQTIWATLHGVAMLLINSPEAGKEDQQRVIDGYIELIVNGLRVR